MNILKNVLNAATALVQKRAGLYISRPIVNAQRWYDWAVKAGIPSPVPPERMHVTIVYSRVDVKCKPMMDTVEQAADRCVIQRMGADGSVLVVLWDDCYLSDRHYFLRYHGATSDWAGFRVHMTLSYAAGDFEIPDEMLAQMPEMIVLGPEVHAPLNEDAVADLKKSAPAGDFHSPDAEDSGLAQKALAHALAEGLGNPLERAVIRDIANGHPVADGELVALGKAEWLQDFYRKEAGSDSVAEPAAADPAPVTKTVVEAAKEMVASAVLDPTVNDVTLNTLAKIAEGEDVSDLVIASMPPEILKKLSGFMETSSHVIERGLLTKGAMQVDDDEQRIAWGWASVSTHKGEDVTDLHQEEITTRALYKMAHGLIRGARAGLFDHQGMACNEIVEAMVFCKERQKALGIDLGQEGLLISMHVPDDNNWELVKSGDWMFSIGARAIVTTLPDS